MKGVYAMECLCDMEGICDCIRRCMLWGVVWNGFDSLIIHDAITSVIVYLQTPRSVGGASTLTREKVVL